MGGFNLQTDTGVSNTVPSTICPFLTSLTVGQLWLLQPYDSCYTQPTHTPFQEMNIALPATNELFSHVVLFELQG